MSAAGQITQISRCVNDPQVMDLFALSVGS
jgi:hypothetical protein